MKFLAKSFSHVLINIYTEFVNHKKNIALLLSFIFILGCNVAIPQNKSVEWTAYGRDLQGTRYVPAKQITKKNINKLKVEWTYRTGETKPKYKTSRRTSFQATPIVVDGLMYLSTPLGRVIALNPESGKEIWEFDPKIRRDVSYGDFANRGVSTWLDKKLSKKYLLSAKDFYCNGSVSIDCFGFKKWKDL